MLPVASGNHAHLIDTSAAALGISGVAPGRVGMCITYSGDLQGKRVFVRIHQPGVDATSGSLAAAAAADNCIPCPRPLSGPHRVDGHQIWIWEHLEHTDQPIDPEVMGRIVARLHLTAVPDIARRDTADHRLAVIAHRIDAYRSAQRIDPADADTLARAATAAHRAANAAAPGRPGLCHGDLKPSNVLHSNGRPHLVDWDSACHSDTSWDVACWVDAVSTSATDTARAAGDAARFLDAYQGAGGHSVDPERIDALGELKALSVLTFLLGRDDPASCQEAATRLRSWTHGAPRLGWTDL